MASSVLEYIKSVRKYSKKIAIIGPSGAGKTTFLETFFGKFKRSDVKRRHEVEDEVDDIFVALSHNRYDEQSTTTISMNQLKVKLVVTSSNQLHLIGTDEDDDHLEIEDQMEVNFIDNPGQNRFDFMSEINLRGSEAVIIMLDGTSTASLTSLKKYVDMVTSQEKQSGRDIPILVFVNKADLAQDNLFLGKETVIEYFGNILMEKALILFETSNKNPISFEFPLRTLLNIIDH